MADLVIGAVGMVLLSLALFVAGRRLGRSCSRRTVSLTAALASLFVVLFVLMLWDSLTLTWLIPTSNVIVLGNWQPPAAALLCGVASVTIAGHWWRRSALLVPLVIVSLWKAYTPLLASPPELLNAWNKDVCLQTSESSCSPAAAATLLRAYGIPATEAEMAELCLTTERGTTMHGLYRGLALKTLGTPWKVEGFEGDVGELRGLVRESGPVILTVGLKSAKDVDRRYVEQWGWIPGAKHTVVLFGFDRDNKVRIGDPNVGRELWSLDGLHTLSHGEGLRLVPRSEGVTYARTSPAEWSGADEMWAH